MEETLLVPDEAIATHTCLASRQVHWIRGEKVMLAFDLAKLYGVPTKRLNEQVKRNMDRVPPDLMPACRTGRFKLNEDEWSDLRSQFATSRSWGGRRVPPYVFTEHGVLMLSSVLNSDRAIAVNTSLSAGRSGSCASSSA